MFVLHESLPKLLYSQRAGCWSDPIKNNERDGPKWRRVISPQIVAAVMGQWRRAAIKQQFMSDDLLCERLWVLPTCESCHRFFCSEFLRHWQIDSWRNNHKIPKNNIYKEVSQQDMHEKSSMISTIVSIKVSNSSKSTLTLFMDH